MDEITKILIQEKLIELLLEDRTTFNDLVKEVRAEAKCKGGNPYYTKIGYSGMIGVKKTRKVIK